VKPRRTLGWIAPLALALLAAAVAAFVPATSAEAAGAAPITVPFDHLTTGFELDGVHRDLPCESCHLNAVFRGTPRDCGTCHIKGSLFNATPKTQTHIPSTNKCAACHNTISFRPDMHFSHAEVMGSCVSCHNGTIATGMTIPPHPNTNQNCAACHTVISWNPPSMVDHTQIPLAVAGFCIICHNGKDASGKNPGHIATSLECGDCHLTTTWLGANFDHTGITTGCVSCHNGTKAVGKQGNHMPTTNLCEDCHTTGIGTKSPSWVPSKFDHTQMTVTTCETCHSGTVKISTGYVSGKPTNHVPVPTSSPNIDCSLCHGNNPSAETWTVIAASIATLHSGLNTATCLMCHGGETFAGVPAPYIPMSISGVSPTKKTPLAPPHIPVLAGTDCSACHNKAYQTGGFGPATAMSAKTHTFVSSTCDTCHDTGKSFYVGSGTPLQLRPPDHINSGDPRMVSGDCSVCHNTTDWTSTAMPTGHMPNPSNLSCLTCHTKSPSDYTPATLAANAVLHTGITGNCGQCHGDNVTALTWANNYTPKDALLTPSHIPYLSGTDCSSCHSSTTYAVGGFGPMNMTQAKHAFAPPACNTCHEAGLSFYMGSASPKLQGRPTDHTGLLAAPNDCSQCHTTANWNSNVLPAGHMPNPGNQGCTVCHTTAPADYTTATLAATPVLHTGISNGCATCHGGFSALTWANNYTPKDGILTPAHIPYTSGSDCSSCHASNYVTGGFGPTNMSAAKHAFVPAVCATCHEAGLNFYLGTSTPALQGRPADHLASGDAQQKTSDCSLCHNTTAWNSNTLPIGHMPNPAAQACAVCHTAITGTFASYATLGSVAVLHTGITGNCGLCHGSPAGALTFYNNNDNPKAAVLTPTHIPYLSGTDCSSCHASNYIAGGFGPTNMSAAKHAFVPATCDTCHEAGLTFYMGSSTPVLQGRPASHTSSTNPQEVSGDCSGCHNTTDWTTTAKPANHMPTPGTQTCSVCHTAIGSTEASYATLASVAVLHTGITAGNCSQCHGNYTAPLTWYNNYTPKDAILGPPSHIPYLVGTDCSSCHASNYATGGFGPTNMSPAKHAFVPTTCNTCHDTGKSFYLGASTPALQTRPDGTGGTAAYDHIHNPSLPQMVAGDCSQCHDTTAWTTPKNLPGGHMPIPGTQTCTVCHIGGANFAILASTPILHTGIASGCGQCHGGGTQLDFYHVNIPANFIKAAASLSPAHIPSFPPSSSNDCSACHTANYVAGGFGPMNMTQATHASVSNLTCVTCHEAGRNFYIGAANPKLQTRPADHSSGTMLTSDCIACHTTANWNSTALPTGHMPNPGNQNCNTCHTSAPANYKVFASNAVLHTGIAGNCSQCHSGTTQLSFYNNDMVVKDGVLTPAHIPYISGVDCSSCHKSTTYAAGTFGPMNMTQATHAFVGSTCNTCHGTATVSFYIGAASPGLQLRPADHTSGNMVAPNDCSMCHTTANWNSTTLPTGHMPNPANQACTVCHTAAPANYTTLAANSVMHTGIASNCAQCHGATTALTWYNNYTPKDAILAPAHIPYAAGTDCSSCHKSSTYAAGTFGPMNMTQATHGFVSTTCNTCHGTATVSFYIGAASPGLQLRPADHTSGTMLTGDCSGCHTTANWNSTSLPAGHMPNPGNQGCNTCHTSAPANYKVFAANSVLHTGITGNCSQCHGATSQLSFYNNDMVIKDGVLSPSHIPFLSGTDCSSCHKTTTYAAGTFGPMNMTQATHAFVTTTCDTCHASAAGSLYMGAASPALQRRPADHTSGSMLTGDCGGCHTTANWNSGSLPAGHMPNPGNQGCTVCHTAAPSNYATLAANATLHTGITTGCITCHGAPNAAPPVFYLNYTPKDAVLSPVHIPTASTACESCHAVSFTAFSGTTMSAAKHTAMLAATGGTCDQCHDLSTLKFFGVTNLTTRPNGHHVGKDCNGCHSPNNWGGNAQKRTVAAAKTPTNSTIGTVVTSSAATRASALPAAGPSGGDRGFRGSALQAGPAIQAGAPIQAGAAIQSGTSLAAVNHSVSHAGVTSNCASCHNGVLAAGKSAAHIASNNTCQNCHTTLAWLPARFDHQGVTARCVSCHNGVVALGKPTLHVQTNQDCSACHGTITWTAVMFSHIGINAACQTCHNGITATGKQVQHVRTTLDCASCHNTLNWTVVSAPPKPSAPATPRPATPIPRGANSGPTK
jgi:hypothetical protein